VVLEREHSTRVALERGHVTNYTNRVYLRVPLAVQVSLREVPTPSVSRAFRCQLKQAVPCPLR
jgi:hypothetical protein